MNIKKQISAFYNCMLSNCAQKQVFTFCFTEILRYTCHLTMKLLHAERAI